MKKTGVNRSIVKYNGRLAMMKHDDFRFSELEVVCGGTLAKELVSVTGNVHRAKVFTGDNGNMYAVFADWSARLLNENNPPAAMSRRDVPNKGENENDEGNHNL